MSDHEGTSIVSGVLGSFLGGGAIGTMLTALLAAWRKPSAPAEMIAAATSAAQAALGSLTSEVARQGVQIEAQAEEIRELREEHAGCREQLQLSEADRRLLHARLDELMSGRVAPLGERAPLT